MNLLQLVTLVMQGTSVAEIAASHSPHPTAEYLVAYMENQASMTSQLQFFDAEQVPPQIFITLNGQQYEAFFSAEELAAFIADYIQSKGAAASPLSIAEAILHYHEYDA